MRPVHFEIHAADPERCASFYRDVFGWEIERIQAFEYWLVRTGEGRARDRRRDPAPDGREPGSRRAHARGRFGADRAGERRRRGDREDPRCRRHRGAPEAQHPGIGLLAYWKDTESNLFGVLQPEGS